MRMCVRVCVCVCACVYVYGVISACMMSKETVEEKGKANENEEREEKM